MLSVVILAAGKSSRFRSSRPKFLHEISGRPLIDFSIQKAVELKADQIFLVAGFAIEQLRMHIDNILYNLSNSKVHASDRKNSRMNDHSLSFLSTRNITGLERSDSSEFFLSALRKLEIIRQSEQLGTGHALFCCLHKLPKTGKTLVLYADVPLVDLNDLKALINQDCEIAILSDELEDPSGFGRIIRDDNFNFCRIVEDKDASEDQKKIKEINTGVMLINNQYLKDWLAGISNDNSQSEYYLTDIVGLASDAGFRVFAQKSEKPALSMGINTRKDLQKAEALYRKVINSKLLENGLWLYDLRNFYLRGDFSFGLDVEIDTNVILEGSCTFGNGVKIGANCVIKNSIIDDESEVLPFSYIDSAFIGKNCLIGPFVNLRPQVEIKNNVKVGNFVEIKKSFINSRSKIPHLSYIGDAIIGQEVNVGAGSITCNYDGNKKFTTQIGSNCFIGSNVCLIAPIEIGDRAFIGAGSVITKNVKPGDLALARADQINIIRQNKNT